jgi:hypothetical protein
VIASAIPLLDVAPYLAGEPGARERLGAEMRWAFESPLGEGRHVIVHRRGSRR